jgi:BolA protein
MMDRVEWLERALRRAFSPEHLEIEDESAKHAGHAGAAGGGGHYRVLIVSTVFEGRDLLTRQRQVYAALGDAVGSAVHALALRTLTPGEWRRRRTPPPS